MYAFVQYNILHKSILVDNNLLPRENLGRLVGGVCLERWVSLGKMAPPAPRETMEAMEDLGDQGLEVRYHISRNYNGTPLKKHPLK